MTTKKASKKSKTKQVKSADYPYHKEVVRAIDDFKRFEASVKRRIEERKAHDAAMVSAKIIPSARCFPETLRMLIGELLLWGASDEMGHSDKKRKEINGLRGAIRAINVTNSSLIKGGVKLLTSYPHIYWTEQEVLDDEFFPRPLFYQQPKNEICDGQGETP